MSNIQIFNFQGNNVRSMVLDGEPWFVGKDVCLYFGDKNPNRSLQRVDEEDKKVIELQTNGGTQNAVIINESGLYSLLFTMQPQKANKGGTHTVPPEIQKRIEKISEFKHWITAVVLPTIRKTGSYTYKPITDPMEMLQLHYNVLDKHDKELKEVDHRLKEVEMNQRLKWRDQMMNLVHRGCNLTGLPQSVFLGQRVYPELEN